MFVAPPLRRLFVASALLVAGCFGQLFGSWKLNATRSTFAGDIRLKSVAIRIEPRARGEVFTLDRTETNGQTTSSSIILYLDRLARDFQCSGTQSSQRIDGQTIEILHDCGAGGWTRFVRRTAPENRLVFEISEQRADGRFERRLVFDKHQEEK